MRRSSSAEAILPRLPAFAAEFGADFYRLPRNEDAITLVKQTLAACRRAMPFGDGELVPLRAGEPIGWRLQSSGA